MSAIASLIHRAENMPAPDTIRRAAVDWLVGRQRSQLMRAAPRRTPRPCSPRTWPAG